MTNVVKEGDKFITTILTKFHYVKDEDEDDDIEIKFIDMPNNIQNLMLEYFGSSEFVEDEVKGYVFKRITNINECYISYPGFDGYVDDIKYKIVDGDLYLDIYITMKLLSNDYIKSEMIESGAISHDPYECYKDVTVVDVEEKAKDGFHKLTHAGSLGQDYGDYIGSFLPGQYQILMDYHNVSVSRI
ncbi:Hypothetical protein ORPV_244 [Orpheovirus IHUMI-LCC2]|uniref:Uncharacterized protein n=1 Tax=Orpheovirus IHUMI-LCC2 TaxID=2023057 RepID=A0A2I2L3P1_9VIRU|nr:Hypothetical protein ORPV_244 [Orpheovirus IHUMI-LCC2]SNW62148.1 Hypothetical protein ORPV_244 [Orpheovirus IHUMI-LCC2]